MDKKLNDEQYQRWLKMEDAFSPYQEEATLYGGPRSKALQVVCGGVPMIIHESVLKYLAEKDGIKAKLPVACWDCKHKREENGVLRCPYRTTDLTPEGFCEKGEK